MRSSNKKYLKQGIVLVFFSVITLVMFGSLISISGCATSGTISSQNASTASQDKDLGNHNILGRVFIASRSLFNQTYYEFDDGNESITLKSIPHVDAVVAESLVSDRLTLFRSIFEPKRVDYPGAYTQTIICPEEYKPKYDEINLTAQSASTENSGAYLKYFVGYANSNKVAGACSADLIAYHYAYGFMYCPGAQSLVEIEYYAVLPLNTTQSFMKNLDCTMLKE